MAKFSAQRRRRNRPPRTKTRYVPPAGDDASARAIPSHGARGLVLTADGWSRHRGRCYVMRMMPMLAGNRQVPAAADSDQAQAEAQGRSEKGRDRRRNLDLVPQHDNRRSAQRGDGVELGPQHDGNLPSTMSRAMPPPMPVSMPNT